MVSVRWTPRRNGIQILNFNFGLLGIQEALNILNHIMNNKSYMAPKLDLAKAYAHMVGNSPMKHRHFFGDVVSMSETPTLFRHSSDMCPIPQFTCSLS